MECFSLQGVFQSHDKANCQFMFSFIALTVGMSMYETLQ